MIAALSPISTEAVKASLVDRTVWAVAGSDMPDTLGKLAVCSIFIAFLSKRELMLLKKWNESGEFQSNCMNSRMKC